MIYEYRVYQVVPGKLAALNARFAEITLQLFAKHGLTVVGFWEPVLGGRTNELHYMLSFQDLADREKAWASFGADPEWRAAVRETEAAGPLLETMYTTIMRPTAYSPLP
ncbi:MAG: NIPSNAP family protein [Chloroflexi bacterium]|nr:NIPSNAP family protein [Chloroflexota bacterium]